MRNNFIRFNQKPSIFSFSFGRSTLWMAFVGLGGGFSFAQIGPTPETQIEEEPVVVIEGIQEGNIIEYTSAGTATFNTHLSSTSVRAIAIGGGGAGGFLSMGGSTCSFCYKDGGTGGGGGGAYAQGKVPVIGGQDYSVVVGNGGVSPASKSGPLVHGFESSFLGSGVGNERVIAKGGKSTSTLQCSGSDCDQVTNNGAEGGSAAESSGQLKFNGGKGGNGNIHTSGFPAVDHPAGGGGGAAARLDGNGFNGSDGAGGNGGVGGVGAAPSGGGGNGAGGNNSHTPAIGKNYGGGGGGTSGSQNVEKPGASGASGYVKLAFITIDQMTVSHTDPCNPVPIVLTGSGYTQSGNTVADVKVNGTSVSFTVNSDTQLTITDLNGAITPDEGSAIEVVSDHGDAKSLDNLVNTTRFILTDGNWSDASIWKDGLTPTIDTCVRVPNGRQLTVDVEDAEALKLVVLAGGQIIVDTDRVLTVKEEIYNFGTADDFWVKNDANLIQIEDVSNVGEIKVERSVETVYKEGDRIDYIYWASPVENQSFADFAPDTDATDIYQYNEVTDLFNQTPDTEFGMAKAYAIGAEGNLGSPYDKTYEFKGTANNGLVNFVGLKKSSTSTQGFNLVGNPYPSNIDLDLLFDGNAGIHTSALFWQNMEGNHPNLAVAGYEVANYAIYNKTGGNPATYFDALDFATPNGIAKSGQGFLVQKRTVGTGNLAFNNSMRVKDAGAFYHKDTDGKDRFWLSLTSPSGVMNATLVGYIEGATDEVEWDFDAKELGASDAIYSLAAGQNLAVQGKAHPHTTIDVVPLGVRAYESGEYNIGLQKTDGIFDENQKIYLRDKQELLDYDLSENGTYAVELTAGLYEDRFEIVYVPTMGTWDVNLTGVQIYKDQKELVISSKTDGLLKVELYNLNGQSVYRKSGIHQNELRIPFGQMEKQILVVKVLTDKGEQITQKVILK